MSRQHPECYLGPLDLSPYLLHSETYRYWFMAMPHDVLESVGLILFPRGISAYLPNDLYFWGCEKGFRIYRADVPPQFRSLTLSPSGNYPNIYFINEHQKWYLGAQEWRKDWR